MDDPWGSPWAATNDDGGGVGPAKLDLPAPPLQAHVSTTPRKATPVPTAPWDEEDAWGGWNEAAGSGAAGIDSPGWGRSPGLRPVSSSVSRQVSPDPWAKVGDGRTLTESPLKSGDGEGEARGHRSPENWIVDSAISFGGGQDRDGDSPRADGKAKSFLDHDTIAQNPQDTEQCKSPVSDPIDRTRSPEGSPPGLPMSIRERPEPSRQSSKVQELVEMYDGMANRGMSPRDAPSLAEEEEEEEEEERDPSSVEAPRKPFQTADVEPLAPVDDAAHEAALESIFDRAGDNEEVIAAPPDHPKQEEPTGSRRPSAVQYTTDLSSLDVLFPGVETSFPAPELLPDVIIDDSFTSVSERKAWYRVSRPGPMRQHNLGDDEGYVRLSWKASMVRNETLKTVRRWMEEDSIAGRAVLGRRTGHVGGHMFNWDSTAPPVEIGALLGKDKSGHRRRSSRGSRAAITSPSVANFDWSSPPTSPAASIRRSTDGIKPGKAAADVPRPVYGVMPSPVLPPGSESSAKKAAPSTTTKPRPHPIEVLKVDDEDEDDEWGEMVSSPGMGGAFDQGPSARVDYDPRSIDGIAISPTTSLPTYPTLTHFQSIWDAEIPEKAPASQSHATTEKERIPASMMGPDDTPATTNLSDPSLPSPSLTQQAAPSSESKTNQDDVSQRDEETIVRILNGLPDLSYMLK